MNAPPPIEEGSAATIVARLVTLLESYTKHPNPVDPGDPYPFGPWSEFDPATGQPVGLSAALIGIFARFAEIVTQRLNRVPEKNFLAFLDLLGAAREPPQPARVPLTFSLVAGRTDDAVVLAGTQVAAQPEKDDPGPVVFEVEEDLTVTAASLASLWTVDPEEDTWSASGGRDALAPPFLAFRGNRPVERVLYVGDGRLLGYGRLAQLRLKATIERPVTGPTPSVQWEYWDGAAWAPIDPSDDGTGQLTQTGTITFGPLAAVPPPLPVGARESRWIRARLLTPVTGSRVPVTGMMQDVTLPVIKSLEVEVDVSTGLTTGVPVPVLRPEAGFANGVELDLTKDFFPFGERPKQFDTFYLACLEGFSKDPTAVNQDDAAEVSLQITLAAVAVVPSDDLQLSWEVSTATGWAQVGTSDKTADATPSNGFMDATGGLTTGTANTDGTKTAMVRLRLPDDAAPTTVNGKQSAWLRVRILKGNYGVEGHYELRVNSDPAVYDFVPANFTPPVIESVLVGYKFTAKRPPEVALTSNYEQLEDVTALAVGPDPGFSPFVRWADQDHPSLYLGFTLPKGRKTFPNSKLGLYASIAPARYGEPGIPLYPDASELMGAPADPATHELTVTNGGPARATLELSTLGHAWTATLSAPSVTLDPGEATKVQVTVTVPVSAPIGTTDQGFLEVRDAADAAEPPKVAAATFTTVAGTPPTPKPPRLRWEYWTGDAWAQLSVKDGSLAFTLPGLVELLAPADFTPRSLFGEERHWLRAVWTDGEYSVWPRLQNVLLNTTPAVQSVTVTNEVLGSSSGAKNQVFRATRAPVLAGPRLEVREVERPGADELKAIIAEEGEDAVPPDTGAARPRDLWIRWHEVKDFYASGPRDRHYVLDHLTGVVRLGDGESGQIPPIGSGNIRLAQYQTGGGANANRAAGKVTQLKTTVPYIDKVINSEPAAGGAEAESLESLYERMPRTLRHRDRAVTVEDYEDLSALASTEVARSRCVPLRDLSGDQLGVEKRPGTVSVIVVPRSVDPKPRPSLELVGRVRRFLEERAPAGVALAVVGPLYIRADVQAEIGVTSLEGARTVAREVRERLDAFLHPLTGGLEGTGWDFGRAPHRSDVLALIEGVEGVDHVRFLQIDEAEDVVGVRDTGRFLVCSGRHEIDAVFTGTGT